MNQKYSIELDLPMVGENTEEAQTCVSLQVKQAIDAMKVLLGMYKKGGMIVPTLSVKLPKGVGEVKATPPSEFKTFSTKLIDHLLKHMPKEDVPAQMRAIKSLYATGMSAEDLITLFDEVRLGYPLTTWHTVRYNLTKRGQVVENKGFDRRELDDEEKENLKARLKTYITA